MIALRLGGSYALTGIFITVVSLLVVAGLAATVSAEDGSKQRFLTEAPNAWAHLERYADRVDISACIRTTNSGPGMIDVPPEEINVHYITKDDAKLLELIQTSGKSEVFGANLRYGLLLNRSSEDDPFLVRYIGTGKADKDSIKNKLSARFEQYVVAPYRISDKTFNELLREPTFRINSVSSVSRGGEDLARVDFAYTPANPETSGMRGGWCLFAPDQLWGLRESENETPWGKVACSVEYGEKHEGLPTLRRVTTTIINKDGRSQINSCEFSKWDNRSVPDRDFTLAAFGLPEIDTDSRVSTTDRAQAWWIGLGLLCAAAAIALCMRRPRMAS